MKSQRPSAGVNRGNDTAHAAPWTPLGAKHAPNVQDEPSQQDPTRPLTKMGPLREKQEGHNRYHMNCRVDRLVDGEHLVVLRVSGRITADHVDMLRALVAREPGRIAIDLKDVLLLDREAVKLLARCELAGAELRNCPPYIREWVTREMKSWHG